MKLDRFRAELRTISAEAKDRQIADLAKRVVNAIKAEPCPTCNSSDKRPLMQSMKIAVGSYTVDALCNGCGDTITITIKARVADA